jgi:hypothetical protein
LRKRHGSDGMRYVESLQAAFMDEDEEDDDEDEDEDEEMEDRMDEDVMPGARLPSDLFGDIKGIDKNKPALPIETWLKFMSVMAMPRQ